MRALVLLALVAGCSIDHPTEALACTTQADCDPSRTCTDGFCVAGNAPNCPGDCITCDLAAKTCTLAGGGNKITCPSGFHCTLACGNNACRDVDCGNAASCTITCSGNNSCDAITCGAGPCTVTCSGSGTCADVDCRDSCACDVTCTGGASCGGVRCPDGCAGDTGCSSAPATCGSC